MKKNATVHYLKSKRGETVSDFTPILKGDTFTVIHKFKQHFIFTECIQAIREAQSPRLSAICKDPFRNFCDTSFYFANA